MLKRVLETIKENNMLKAGDKVVCALSGGADSMALLCALYEIKDNIGIEVYAAHLNHSVRGKAADEDYEFVKEFCEKKGIELFYKKVDVPKLSKELHKGEEEVGRDERYKLFYEAAEKLGGALIATGHHRNDNAETILFNLFRGSGSRGLGGIRYKRGNVIRPLLDVTREDTENFLKSRGISWREDDTNKKCIYARNKIRLVILKEIERFFPDAAAKIVSAAKIVRIDDDYLTEAAKNTGAFENGAIVAAKFLPLHESLRRRVIIEALEAWDIGDINAEKIKAVYETVLGQTGKGRDLGNNIRIVNNYGTVSKKEKNEVEKRRLNHTVNSEESLEIQASEGEWSIKTVDKTEKMRDNKMMILLDADKLKNEVSVRCRQDGDYISPCGMAGTKKLKKVFIDLKIPKEKRDMISMLTMGSEVLFIPGIRKTKNYLPDESTKRVLIAEYKRK